MFIFETVKHTILLIISFFLLAGTGWAQDDCACCTEFHDQFDFWVGQWKVYDTLGTLVGENNIQKLEDNCLISERWEGMKGFTGRSFNYFDASDSTWNQVWVDNNGGNLILKGEFSDGKMVLRSQLLKGQKVDWYYNQISWTPNEDGSVLQLWEVYSKNGLLLAEIFKGIYRKQ
jgi:hypothetical protein